MGRPAAQDTLARETLDRFLDLLDSADDVTAGTSIRLPGNLREAAWIATQVGYGVSVSELTVKGLRDVLEGISWRLILDEHYRQYPEARPSLAEVAIALAEMDDNPLCSRPDLIARAAEWASEHHPDADADDVLFVAAGMELAELQAKL
jgi:hypothetical protein